MGSKIGVLPLTSAQVELIKGGCKPDSPASRPDTPSSRTSNLSPGLSSHTSSLCVRPDTPSNSHPRYSPKLPITHAGGRISLPGCQPASPATTRNMGQSKLSPRVLCNRVHVAEAKPTSPALSPASCVSSSHRLSPGLPRHLSEDTRCNSPVSSASLHGAPSKTNVANKRKRRLDDYDNDIPLKKNNDSSNGEEKHNVKLKGLNGIVHKTHVDLGVREVVDHPDISDSEDVCNTQFHSQKAATENNLGTPGPSVEARECADMPSDAVLPEKETGELCRTPLSGDSQRGKLERTPYTKSMSRTPKVKSTAELIQHLYSKGSLPIIGSKTVEKIARNQIEREPDTIGQPVVPPEAKPRPRRKPVSQIVPPNASDKTLSETKNEMVHKFLQSSVPAICMPSSDVDLTGLSAPETQSIEFPLLHQMTTSDNESLHDSSSSSISVGDMQEMQLQTIVEHPNDMTTVKLGEGSPQSVVAESAAVNIIPELPPLNEEEIVWDDEEYEMPQKKEVTDIDVENLHTELIPGINGQLDNQGSWHSWTSTYSMPTYSGDLLHILPYVNIDQ